MKRIQNRLFPLAVSLAILGGAGSVAQVYAQLSLKLIGPDGQVQEITGHNAPRGDEALVLYDKAFGHHTRTNAYGVEVVAVPITPYVTPPVKPTTLQAPNDLPANSDEKLYRVVSLTSVWECNKPENHGKHDGQSCGNAPIPADGIVISATGSKRDWLKNLKAGDTLTLQEDWFQQRQVKVDSVDPSPTNNSMGAGFPGFRASNQIVAYDAGYGRPNTGTNEFGFEVTVRNGVVTAQEGSDSSIPTDGFVLSGHGKGRSWLIANTPLGAKVQLAPDGKTLSSTIDFDTYTYQFNQRWAASPCSDAAWNTKPTVDQTCNLIRDKRDKALSLQAAGNPVLAAATIQEALEGMNERIWKSYQSFPNTAIRGAWHRPVETTPAAVAQTLDTLKAAGINTVFLETYFHGYTIFPSQTFQAYGLTAENPKFQGVDLLQLWTDEAHKRNMQVHTWFQVFYGGTKVFNPPGPILSKYPSWANVQFSALVPVQPVPPTLVSPPSVSGAVASPALPPVSKSGAVLNVYRAAATLPGKAAVATPLPVKTPALNGSSVTPASLSPAPIPVVYKAPDKPVPSSLELGAFFLDPANPDVQTFLLKLSNEIVSRYKIDGFQLDYIRYPASFPADRFSYRKTTWGYTDVARKAFKAQSGIDPVDIDPKNPQYEAQWAAWNQFKVAQVSNFVQKATTSIRQINPNIKISAAVFPEADKALAVKHQDWLSWAQHGWIDFFAPMTLTSATKVVDRDTRRMIQVTQGKVPVYSGIFGPFNENTTEQVLSQIDTAKQAGASGYVLFDTAHLTARTLNALRTVQMPQVAVQSAPAVETEPAAEPRVKHKKRHWWSRK